MCKQLRSFLIPSDVTEVVCGAAKGPDTYGMYWADEENIPVKYFHPDWKTFGKSAGHRRNVQMADYGQALVAFWDGSSKGTANMIKVARQKGLKVKVFTIEDAV